MHVLKITKQLKDDIETNQNQLLNSIRNHQGVAAKLKQHSDDDETIAQELAEAESKIVELGIFQLTLMKKLREEFKNHQQSVKTEVVTRSLDERRSDLVTSISRARKQKLMTRERNSPSDESEGRQSPPRVRARNPTRPEHLSQITFLEYFRLATNDVYAEMLKKKAERKRRSTANPQFVYSKRGDQSGQPPKKKKRKTFLRHAPSPPNTRSRKNQEPGPSNQEPGPSTSKSPPRATNGKKSPLNGHKTESSFPAIPNLPSGLIIERISPGRTSPEPKQCIVCKKPGALSICEQCSNAFHMGCHNRPFPKPPRNCPKCLAKKARRSASSSSSSATSGMTIILVSPTDLADKMKTKQELQEKHADLVAELTQLQNRHSELTISLKNQESDKDNLTEATQMTEDKITQLAKFIGMMKKLTEQETACTS
ncbi:PHD finger protein 21A-like [Dendroctonus ponderosae]|uniref:PHD finger protein 21A-like n=1 Tax=Dendroctonus ponderosae TaxID=77166 RepID=UPI0020357566|nr:PHD finger protein 21A-like [Dendroctonus ponderosae]